MKLSEVIAEIENGSTKTYQATVPTFKRKAQMNAKGGYFQLKILDEGRLIGQHNGGGAFNGNIMLGYDWKPIPEYVTWQEALKAMSEGEKICCEVCGLEYRSVQGFLVEPVMINKGIWSVE